MEFQSKKLKIGVLLPHTKVYGGVKRYMEIGNICRKAGHDFTIYTEDGVFSGWFPYEGLTRTYSALQ